MSDLFCFETRVLFKEQSLDPSVLLAQTKPEGFSPRVVIVPIITLHSCFRSSLFFAQNRQKVENSPGNAVDLDSSCHF